jgi:transposase-like protein
MKEREQEKQPQIISDLNANLGTGDITVESLAEKLGITTHTLYKWVQHDSEFSEALEIIKEV